MPVLAMAMTFGVSAIAAADPLPGPIFKREIVRAFSSDAFKVHRYGGEVSRVTVCGDGDSDLDVYVYDEKGNLIAFDDGESDYCQVSFAPNRTQSMIVRVVNRGALSNVYSIWVD
jgi:hypothetical protein